MSTVYLAVRCQDDPKHIIHLKVLTESGWAVEPFRVTCPECGRSHQYGQHAVFKVAGLPPDEAFEDHPAF